MGKFFSYATAVMVFLMFSVAVQAQEAVSVASLYNDALAKLKEKNYAEALPLLEQAIEKANPEDETEAKVINLSKKNGAIAAYKVGNDHRKDGELDQALMRFQQGIDFNPGFYANYIGKAQTLEDQDNKVEAVKAYVEAGEASKEAGKADKYEQMISKAENFSALAYADKNWEETITLAEAFLGLEETADAHYYLSFALKEKAQHEKAIEHAEKGMALDAEAEDTGRYLMVKAESLEKMGKTDEAVATYGQITSGKYAERAQYKANELTGGK